MEGKFDRHTFSPADLMRRVANLERELRALQTARRMEATSVGAGGLRVHSGGRIRVENADGDETLTMTSDLVTLAGLLRVLGSIDVTEGALRVFDDEGRVVAQVGKLPDGTYGVAAIDPTSGALVSLSTLAFGLRAAVNTSLVTINSSTWDDPAFGDDGPTITNLPIGNSGRCILFVGAQFGVLNIPDGQTGNCQMSFEVSGATSRSPGTDIVELGRQRSGTGGVDVGSGRFANIAFLEELNPGLHTIHAQYQVTGAMSDGNIFRPTLVAFPY